MRGSQSLKDFEVYGSPGLITEGEVKQLKIRVYEKLDDVDFIKAKFALKSIITDKDALGSSVSYIKQLIEQVV
jgi:hypothetical protein